MKINEAIDKAKKHKTRIKSVSLQMFKQDAKSLVHWLITEDTNILTKVITYAKVLKTDDWELDTDGL
jgi:hypothetical protein